MIDTHDIPEDLKEKLRSYGLRDDEFLDVIADVEDVVNLRVLREYFTELNDPTINTLLAQASEEELHAYFEAHKHSLPQLPSEKYTAVAEKTWQEYFAFMDAA